MEVQTTPNTGATETSFLYHVAIRQKEFNNSEEYSTKIVRRGKVRYYLDIRMYFCNFLLKIMSGTRPSGILWHPEHSLPDFSKDKQIAALQKKER